MLYAYVDTDTAPRGSNSPTVTTTVDDWSAFGKVIIYSPWPENRFDLEPIKPCPRWKEIKAASGPGPPPAKVKRLAPFRRIVEPQSRLIE